MSKKFLTIIIAILLYIGSTFLSYSLFSKSISPTDPGSASPVDVNNTNDYQAIVFDPNQPKTEPCPLSGALYSKQQRQWWEKHRPLGVMIENHQEARPQSGLSFADTVYESVAEGGITRFLAVYYCQDAGIIGPVRSARTYFLDYISEYGDYPLYAHVGGANTPGPANALGQIEDYGWSGYNDLNQFSVGFPTYWRDESRQGHPVATEHTMYSTTSKLWKVGEDRDLTDVDKKGNAWNANFTPYTFKDDAPMSDRPSSQTVTINFWDGPAYAVEWDYDKQTNTYLRKNGGVSHDDRNTHKQLSAKNIVVLFETERRANDGYEGNLHMLYGTKGDGDALFFIDGKKIKGTWEKDNRTSRTMLYTNDGSKVQFSRGTIWFEIQPLDADVTVQ